MWDCLLQHAYLTSVECTCYKTLVLLVYLKHVVMGVLWPCLVYLMNLLFSVRTALVTHEPCHQKCQTCTRVKPPMKSSAVLNGKTTRGQRSGVLKTTWLMNLKICVRSQCSRRSMLEMHGAQTLTKNRQHFCPLSPGSQLLLIPPCSQLFKPSLSHTHLITSFLKAWTGAPLLSSSTDCLFQCQFHCCYISVRNPSALPKDSGYLSYLLKNKVPMQSNYINPDYLWDFWLTCECQNYWIDLGYRN